MMVCFSLILNVHAAGMMAIIDKYISERLYDVFSKQEAMMGPRLAPENRINVYNEIAVPRSVGSQYSLTELTRAGTLKERPAIKIILAASNPYGLLSDTNNEDITRPIEEIVKLILNSFIPPSFLYILEREVKGTLQVKQLT